MFGNQQVVPVPTSEVLGKHDYAIPPLLRVSDIFNKELVQWLNSK